MFDVCWVDPARETIGERRNRKEQTTGADRRHKKGIRTPREGSLRSFTSSEASAPATTSTLAKVLQLEVPPPRKAVSRWMRAKSHVGPPPHDITTSTNEEQIPTDSIRSDSPALKWQWPKGRDGRDGLEFAHAEASSKSNAAAETQKPSMTLGSRYIYDRAEAGRLSNADSTCSWSSAADSLVPCSRTNSFVVQPLSPGSFISQSIEVMVDPRDSFQDAKEMRASIISISAAGSSPRQDQLIEPDHPQSSPKKSSPPPAFDPSSLPFSRDSLSKDEPYSNVHGYNQDRPFTTAQPWEAPKAWEYFTSSPESSTPTLTSESNTTHPFLTNSPPPSPHLPLPAQQSSRNASTFPIEFQHIQRSIRLTQNASKKIMLERLREDWSGTMDATLNRELEMHKHMWMVTAMRGFINLDSCQTRRGGLEAGRQRIPHGMKESTRRELDKVLSLFEGYASAAYLAVTIPSGTEMHQLSTTPLSPDQFPNVRPLSVPTAIPSLAYAPNIFSSIHASGLATLFASPAIPKILKECHRVLASPSSRAQTSALTTSGSQQVKDGEQVVNMAAGRGGGVLHLKIVDPCPISATLGPRLRDWLDDHLVFDLERQFRCLHPIRLFPRWLAEAGLYAEGSSITQMSFLASNSMSPEPSESRASGKKGQRGDAEQSVATGEMNQGAGQGRHSHNDDITQDLKTAVGRVLWQEIWGPHVQLKGGNWWWEDNDILDECWSRGTLWEYAVIEAMKG